MNRLFRAGCVAGAFLLLACSVTRKRAVERFSYGRDSVSVIRIDSSFRKSEGRDRLFRSVSLRHVLYSGPDSLGRQFPLSVTTASARSVAERSLSGSSAVSSRRDSSAFRTSAFSEKAGRESERKAFPRWGWWIGGVALAGFGCLGLYRFNKMQGS